MPLRGDSRPAVSVDDVSRCYETASETVWAVRGVSLEVVAGTFVCVFGPSGSGKSTLLSLLAGLDLPTSGRITVDGSAMNTLDEDERAKMRLERVGVVFQDNNLIEEFSAIENVMLPLEARGVGAPEARRRAAAQLASVGLVELGDRLPAKLSGGQRQRVGIARALVGGQAVLLADEPTGALDSVNSRSLFELLRGLCDEGGTTVVLATHELSSRKYADAVYEMRDGRLFRSAGAGA